MNGERKIAFPLTLGIFIGAVLFGIQVSLTAFNAVVNPPQPVRLCHVDKANSGYRVELLGDSWVIPEPHEKIANKISAVCHVVSQSVLYSKYEGVKIALKNHKEAVNELLCDLKETGLQIPAAIKAWFTELRASFRDAS